MIGLNLNNKLQRLVFLSLGFVFLLSLASEAASAEKRNAELLQMLKSIQSSGIEDFSVLKAFRKVPRHEFVGPDFYASAYENKTFTDTEGNVTVEPVLFARMLENSGVEESSRVLIVGSGSGYQVAVLASLVEEVDVIEQSKNAAKTARERVRSLGLPNVQFFVGSAKDGIKEGGAYDAVLALSENLVSADGVVFPRLFALLKSEGKLVVATGKQGQRIKVASGRENGKLKTEAAVVRKPTPSKIKESKKDTGWKIRGLAR